MLRWRWRSPRVSWQPLTAICATIMPALPGRLFRRKIARKACEHFGKNASRCFEIGRSAMSATFLNARDAAELVRDGDTVAISGNGAGMVSAEAILAALELRFLQ